MTEKKKKEGIRGRNCIGKGYRRRRRKISYKTRRLTHIPLVKRK